MEYVSTNPSNKKLNRKKYTSGKKEMKI